MTKTIYGGQYRNTIVCIDKYENGILSGRLYNPYFKSGKCFQSTMELLQAADSMLSEIEFPGSCMADRRFQDVPQMQLPEAEPLRKGKKATFVVDVLFHQHASWQGTIHWADKGRVKNFRSVMELLFLMDSVLREKK